MWLFTKEGFFSAVQHKDDPDTIHVRGRFKGDLERLWRKYLEGGPIVEYTPDNDYPFRMDVSRTSWSIIVEAEAKSIDYENFKNAVHDGTKRDRAYLDIWAALRRQQG